MSDSFSLDITRFVEKAQGRIGVVVRKVTLDVFSSVIMMSPVDTGRFRGNWIAGEGSMPITTSNISDQSGSETMSKVTAIVNASSAGGVVFMVNNLPYAQRLEYGYSSQAPAGMVRTTIANYQSFIKTAITS